MNANHSRLAGCERSRLVEQQYLALRELFEHGTALDDHAESRRTRQARNHGDRCRQDQWARCRHDEDRNRSNRVARQRPGEPGDEPTEHDEHGAVAIGHPNERCGGRFGLLHQPHDRGVRRIGSSRCRSHLERPAGIDHAAANLVARNSFDLPRLAGERRLVEHRRTTLHTTVDGEHLTGPHQQQIPRGDHIGGNLAEAVAIEPLHRPGGSPDERTEVTLSTRCGTRLDRPTAGEHQGDDRSGEHLADGERAKECREGDDIGAEATLTGGRDHRPDRRNYPEQRRGEPRRVRRRFGSHPPGDRADDQADGCCNQQGLFEVGCPQPCSLFDAHAVSTP